MRVAFFHPCFALLTTGPRGDHPHSPQPMTQVATHHHVSRTSSHQQLSASAAANVSETNTAHSERAGAGSMPASVRAWFVAGICRPNPGTLDDAPAPAGFASGTGKITNLAIGPTGSSTVLATVTQPDGKILLAGYYRASQRQPGDVCNASQPMAARTARLLITRRRRQ